MIWELKEVDDVECTMDDSGVHVVIHRIVRTEKHKQYAGERVSVRADLNTDAGEPIVSFQGSANAVRKHLLAFIVEYCNDLDPISLEHASYIGFELLRAEVTPDYVQD